MLNQTDTEPNVDSELSAIERNILDSVQALQIAERLDDIEPHLGEDQTSRIRFLVARATIENRLRDPQKALATAHEARRVAGEGGPPGLKAAISRLVATIHTWRGQGEAAMAELLRAIAEAKIASDREAEAGALADAVRAAKEIRRHDLALVFLDSVLAEPALDAITYARALIDRLQILNRLARHRDCIEAVDACAAAVEETGISRLRHLRLLEKARAFAGTGNFAAARAALDEDRAHLPEDVEEYEHLEWMQASVHVSAAALASDEAGADDPQEESLYEIVERFRMDALHRQEAEGRLELAEYLQRLGETEGALEQAAAALMIANAEREPSLAEQARSLLLRFGGSSADLEETATGLFSDRYLLGPTLGQGGYGLVKSAYDLETGAQRAIKFIDLHDITNPVVRARMISDARAEINAARRVRHPGLVRIHSIFVDEETIVVVQDLVNGETLDAIAGSALDPLTMLNTLVQVAHAVAALHQAGIVHRDLKPDNIMVDALSRPTLIDLGLASIAGSAVDNNEPVRGARRYIAPELLTTGERPAPDPRQDIYSFGVICSDLLGDQPGFGIGDMISRLAGGRSRRQRRLIDQMRAGAPGDRPQTMIAVAEILESELRKV
ncbi:MAG: serine/threonine-protein kinase [Rhizobiaceae bacterium]